MNRFTWKKGQVVVVIAPTAQLKKQNEQQSKAKKP